MRATTRHRSSRWAGTCMPAAGTPISRHSPDVLQLNAFQPGLRQAVTGTIADIAGQCDGIRCDMADAVLNDIFERTWGARAGAKPPDDYWRKIIPATKAQWPEFRFIAEAYWDLEWELQQQGFANCYDKKLYDRMEHADAGSVRQHLLADPAYQEGMVRFIENHDEPRAATAFPDGKRRAAATAILTLPGARLLHEGQVEGLKVRVPVFLARRPVEPADQDLANFYGRLLRATNRDASATGTGVFAGGAAGPTIRAASISSPGAGPRAASAIWPSSISGRRPPRRLSICPGMNWEGSRGTSSICSRENLTTEAAARCAMPGSTSSLARGAATSSA